LFKKKTSIISFTDPLRLWDGSDKNSLNVKQNEIFFAKRFDKHLKSLYGMKVNGDFSFSFCDWK